MTTTVHHHPTRGHSHNHRKTAHVEIAEEAHGLLDRLSLSSLSEEAKELVSRLRQNLESLKESAEAAQKQLQAGLHATETKIKHNPWTAVGIATAGGVLLGLFLRRHRAHRPDR